MLNEKIVNLLFMTGAIKVSEYNKPFWYTSGTIGPYYINTHFLFGSEEKANQLLKTIDNEKPNKLICPLTILKLVEENYNCDNTYKCVIDEMCNLLINNINISQVDYISGGERRDWFFSMMIAKKLNMPHLTIYKNQQLATNDNVSNNIIEIDNLMSRNIIHIADLITEASSYDRAWIPAIKERRGNMKASLVVVDRLQGGEQFLESQGIKLLKMVDIDRELFEKALSMGYINNEQYELIVNYLIDPKGSMEVFLKENPEFIKKSLQSDEKTRERALLCLEKNVYNI